MSNYMLKDYKAKGYDFESFKEESDLIDRSTIIKRVPTDFTTALYCYSQRSDNEGIISNCQMVFEGSVFPDLSGDFERVEKVSLRSHVSAYSNNRKLLLELNGNFLLNFEGDPAIPDKNFFLDDAAIKTLATKLSVNQSLLQKRDSFTKAMIITTAITDIEKISIVYRTNGLYNRIIAFVGDKYQRTPFSKVQELTQAAMGQFKFHSWIITNKGATVALEYKDYLIKIRTSDNCEFSDSVTVYLNKDFEYKLHSKAISDIDNMKEYFRLLKEGIDNVDSDMVTSVTYEAVKGAISNALGLKTSKIALSYIETHEKETFKAVLEIPEMIELSDNQKKEYSNIFLHSIGDRICA